MTIRATLAALLAALLAASAPAAAPILRPEPYSYADLTDLAADSPVVAVATVRSATRLKPVEAPGLAAGLARFYVEADIVALLRSPGEMGARLAYLADVPLAANGKPPALKKARVLLFAAPVAGRPGTVRLLGRRGQAVWDAGLETRVRAVLAGLASADRPPQVIGVGNAFHVPGSLPGESETQIFLATADGRPVSLSILRRPGEQPRWAVALGEMTDEAALPPQRDTLLWYRLACSLPAALPAESVTDLSPSDAAATRDDYGVVLAGLGACGRTMR